MKLIQILENILNEYGIIDIPRQELAKSDLIYNYLNKGNNYKKTIDRLIDEKAIDLPKIGGKKITFNLTTVLGTPLEIAVILFHDDETAALGKYDKDTNAIYINLRTNPPTQGDFKRTVEHELIHALDYYTENDKAYKKELSKLKNIPTDSNKLKPRHYKKYFSSNIERQTVMGPLINTISDNLNKFKSKRAYVGLLDRFLVELKNGKTPEELINIPKYDLIPYLFTTEDFDPQNLPDEISPKVLSDFGREMNIIEIYLQTPEIYDQFVKRLFRKLV
jgi:hypothetical protein